MSMTRDEAWNALALHPDPTLEELFAADPDRVDKLTGRIELGEVGIRFDWSKTHLTDELLAEFEALAEASDRREMRDRLAQLLALMMKQPQPEDDAEIAG